MGVFNPDIFKLQWLPNLIGIALNTDKVILEIFNSRTGVTYTYDEDIDGIVRASEEYEKASNLFGLDLDFDNDLICTIQLYQASTDTYSDKISVSLLIPRCNNVSASIVVNTPKRIKLSWTDNTDGVRNFAFDLVSFKVTNVTQSKTVELLALVQRNFESVFLNPPAGSPFSGVWGNATDSMEIKYRIAYADHSSKINTITQNLTANLYFTIVGYVYEVNAVSGANVVITVDTNLPDWNFRFNYVNEFDANAQSNVPLGNGFYPPVTGIKSGNTLTVSTTGFLGVVEAIFTDPNYLMTANQRTPNSNLITDKANGLQDILIYDAGNPPTYLSQAKQRIRVADNQAIISPSPIYLDPDLSAQPFNLFVPYAQWDVRYPLGTNPSLSPNQTAGIAGTFDLQLNYFFASLQTIAQDILDGYLPNRMGIYNINNLTQFTLVDLVPRIRNVVPVFNSTVTQFSYSFPNNTAGTFPENQLNQSTDKFSAEIKNLTTNATVGTITNLNRNAGATTINLAGTFGNGGETLQITFRMTRVVVGLITATFRSYDVVSTIIIQRIKNIEKIRISVKNDTVRLRWNNNTDGVRAVGSDTLTMTLTNNVSGNTFVICNNADDIRRDESSFTKIGTFGNDGDAVTITYYMTKVGEQSETATFNTAINAVQTYIYDDAIPNNDETDTVINYDANYSEPYPTLFPQTYESNNDDV